MMPSDFNDITSKVLRFGLVGLAVTFLYVAVFVLAKLILSTTLSVCLAYIVATAFGFFMHKLFSFQSKRKYIDSLPRYCVMQCVVLLALLMIANLSDVYNLNNDILTGLMSAVFISLISFTFQYLWVFNE